MDLPPLDQLPDKLRLDPVMPRPWGEHGMLGIRPILTVTLAADHRATDGSQGARFLDALNRSLQEAGTL